MRKPLILCLCIIFILSLSIPTFAYEQEVPLFRQVSELDDGITVIAELYQDNNARSSSKGYTWRKTLTKEGVTIAVIAIHGTFSYNGTTVSVVSKSVTQTDTYDGWNYKQNSFTSSGGTITLDAKLTKLLVMNIPFTMTLSCDKNGNISYT